MKGSHTLVIDELPIGMWNETYLTFLEKCVETKKMNLRDYKDLSTDKDIHMELVFSPDTDLHNPFTLDKIVDQFKLTSSLSTNNMYLFNKDESLVKYDSPDSIINDFIDTRLEYYEKRKDKQIDVMENLLKLYSNKYTFIMELLNDTLDLRKKKSQEMETILTEKNYDKIENSYHYLVKMPMDTVNEENVEKLKNDFDSTKQALEDLKNTTIVSMYYKELCELDKAI